MAANRSQSMFQGLQAVWARGGFVGFYQGLIPWVRISGRVDSLEVSNVYSGVDRSLDKRRCPSLHRFGN
jgi:hypothetical protein